jgi:serine/threonine protein kinase
MNLIRYALTERNVLSIIDNPFIVKLYYSFQTSDKLFLILDYCPGGDLSEVLTKEGKFTEEKAKIYLCEIILAIEDLHKRDIIFRDLKPDNVVLDFDGHALLTDFGLSKEGVYDNIGAKSFCG